MLIWEVIDVSVEYEVCFRWFKTLEKAEVFLPTKVKQVKLLKFLFHLFKKI